MTYYTSYKSVQQNCYVIQDNTAVKEPSTEDKIASIAYTVAGIIGIAYQLYILLF